MKVKAIITGLQPRKWGNGSDYIRGTFDIIEGNRKKWAKTDVCPTYRNYRYWNGYLRVGMECLVAMKDQKTVDADVAPQWIGMTKTEPPPASDSQLSLL